MGTVYADAGATATDAVDTAVQARIEVTGLPIDTMRVGEHRITYRVEDESRNVAPVLTRVAVVQVRT